MNAEKEWRNSSLKYQEVFTMFLKHVNLISFHGVELN
jgi:hypothetical protein